MEGLASFVAGEPTKQLLVMNPAKRVPKALTRRLEALLLSTANATLVFGASMDRIVPGVIQASTQICQAPLLAVTAVRGASILISQKQPSALAVWLESILRALVCRRIAHVSHAPRRQTLQQVVIRLGTAYVRKALLALLEDPAQTARHPLPKSEFAAPPTTPFSHAYGVVAPFTQTGAAL
jgi:2-succinyl-5-enolpyruvyl-6-hydroxy-3-cyclohexene-1-carboxylate synthase